MSKILRNSNIHIYDPCAFKFIEFSYIKLINANSAKKLTIFSSLTPEL